MPRKGLSGPTAAEQIRAAGIQLGGPVPFAERELASVLAAWLNSVHRRMTEGGAAPDQPYALEVAQLVLRRSPGKV